MLNFVFLTFVLILYVHIVGCLWYLVVISDYCKQNLFLQQVCNPLMLFPDKCDDLTERQISMLATSDYESWFCVDGIVELDEFATIQERLIDGM
jgi:DNA polymerase III psi subunit